MGSHSHLKSSLSLLGAFFVFVLLVDLTTAIALSSSRSRRDNEEAVAVDLQTTPMPSMISSSNNRKKSNYSCADKEDDGHYEHVDCKKYWHCLYVGTIFEYALERKCPVGTMFHPLQRVCEISTVLTCLNWRKSIYGKNYQDPTTTTAAELTTTTSPGTSDDYDVEEKKKKKKKTSLSVNNNGDNLMRTYLITLTTISTPDLEQRTASLSSSSVATHMLVEQSTTSKIVDLTSETTFTTTSEPEEPEFEVASTTGKPPPLYKKIKSKTTKKGSSEGGNLANGVKFNKDKFTTLFSSNLHEKLKNMNSISGSVDHNSISLDDGFSAASNNNGDGSASIPYAKIKGQGDDLLLNKNFTILTSKGKKTVLMPVQKSLQNLNETIANKIGVLAAINANRRHNASKAFDQVEIIKSIFSLRNRTQSHPNRPKNKKHTTKTAATTATTTTTSSSRPVPLLGPTSDPIQNGDYQNEYGQVNDDWSRIEAIANDVQLNLNAAKESKKVDKNENAYNEKFYVNNINSQVMMGDKQADDYGEESIEATDDLSVLDSDLLLNLQLNTNNNNNNNQYKITNIGKLKKKKKKSKLVKQAAADQSVVELADLFDPNGAGAVESVNEIDEISLDHDLVPAEDADNAEQNGQTNSSESSAQSVDQQQHSQSSSSSSSSSNAFRIRFDQTVLLAHLACMLVALSAKFAAAA